MTIFIVAFYLLYLLGFAAIACGVPLYRSYIAILIFSLLNGSLIIGDVPLAI